MPNPASPARPFNDLPTTAIRSIVGLESATAGVTATGISPSWLLQEPEWTITPAIQRDTYTGQGGTGTAAGPHDRVGLGEYVQLTASGPMRLSSLGGIWTASLVGAGSEGTLPGTPPQPYTHIFTPPAFKTFTDTYTIWLDYGDGTNNLVRYNFCTPTQIQVSFQTNGAAMAEVQLWGQKAAVGQTAPTGIHYVGGGVGTPADNTLWPKTRVLGIGNAFTFYGSSGTAYTTKVTGGSFTLARALEAVPTGDTRTPQDFMPGPLTHEGSLDIVYDGVHANTFHLDYINFAQVGDSGAHAHLIQLNDADTNFMQLVFGPMTFASGTWNDQGQVQRATFGYQANDDLSIVHVGAGAALSAVKTLTVKNAWNALMVL